MKALQDLICISFFETVLQFYRCICLGMLLSGPKGPLFRPFFRGLKAPAPSGTALGDSSTSSLTGWICPIPGLKIETRGTQSAWAILPNHAVTVTVAGESPACTGRTVIQIYDYTRSYTCTFTGQVFQMSAQ
jgi:hypothetical protein